MPVLENTVAPLAPASFQAHKFLHFGGIVQYEKNHLHFYFSSCVSGGSSTTRFGLGLNHLKAKCNNDGVTSVLISTTVTMAKKALLLSRPALFAGAATISVTSPRATIPLPNWKASCVGKPPKRAPAAAPKTFPAMAARVTARISQTEFNGKPCKFTGQANIYKKDGDKQGIRQRGNAASIWLFSGVRANIRPARKAPIRAAICPISSAARP